MCNLLVDADVFVTYRPGLFDTAAEERWVTEAVLPGAGDQLMM